jgi:branched-chain amino acid transport system ATP-binding protein
VDGVDLSITEGEVRALIGPNGAGKTTLVGLVSGRLEPTSGSIVFAGEDITRLKAHERVVRGIVYTFQITSIFRDLTCFDNVALAAQRHLTRGRSLWAQAPELELRRSATLSLAKVGLASHSDQLAGSLAYGHQRLLELAMGLALRPRLLVLDEPTQGLPEEEVTNFCRLISALREESTVLLIEHNMSVVMRLADRITVMSSGRILAEGTPAEVRGNEAVRDAYLGT